MNEQVLMTGKKECQFCRKEAEYDAKTTMGPWAYLCENCFKKYGVGIGLGKGQKIVGERK